MQFEWDPKKSKRNEKKHGIPFKLATQIWQGIHLNIPNIAKATSGETRGATIGLIGDKVFTAIWTRRNKVIRLISVRRARNGEEKAYWKKSI